MEDTRTDADDHCTVNDIGTMFQWSLHCTVKRKCGMNHALKTWELREKET